MMDFTCSPGPTTGNSTTFSNLKHALEINPSLQEAKLWLANAIEDQSETVRLYEEILLRDPMCGPAFNNLIQNYLGLGEFDKSEALVARVSRITGPNDSVRQAQGTLAFMRGELADARRHLDFAYEANPNASVLNTWRGYTLLLLGDFERAARTRANAERVKLGMDPYLPISESD